MPNIGIIVGSTRSDRNAADGGNGHELTSNRMDAKFEQIDIIVTELQMANLQKGILQSLLIDFVNFNEFQPHAMHNDILTAMSIQWIAWIKTLKQLYKEKNMGRL